MCSPAEGMPNHWQVLCVAFRVLKMIFSSQVWAAIIQNSQQSGGVWLACLHIATHPFGEQMRGSTNQKSGASEGVTVECSDGRSGGCGLSNRACVLTGDTAEGRKGVDCSLSGCISFWAYLEPLGTVSLPKYTPSLPGKNDARIVSLTFPINSF